MTLYFHSQFESMIDTVYLKKKMKHESEREHIVAYGKTQTQT